MLRVQLLGDLRLYLDGTALRASSSRRSWVLLAWLALHRGSIHGRPSPLCSGPTSSTRALAEACGPPCGRCANRWVPPPTTTCSWTRDRIGFLAEADLRLDTDDLDDLVAAGRLVEAADAGAVELLPGVTDDWVLEARDAHRRRMVVMLETLAQQAGADGRTGTAVDWTRRQLAVDPHADEPVRRLMIRLPRPGTGSPRSVPTSATVSCWLVSWTRVRRKS